jgi:hypothetical protein
MADRFGDRRSIRRLGTGGCPPAVAEAPGNDHALRGRVPTVKHVHLAIRFELKADVLQVRFGVATFITASNPRSPARSMACRRQLAVCRVWVVLEHASRSYDAVVKVKANRAFSTFDLPFKKSVAPDQDACHHCGR